MRTSAALLSLATTLGSLAATSAGAADFPDDLILDPIASGFTRPVAVRSAGDGSDRLFVVEQRGIIHILELATGNVLPTPFLDIQAAVDDAGNEQGLLGLAFHPDYATNGFFYVNYTRDPGPGLDRTRIERYTVSANPDVANAGSGLTIVEIEQDFSNHNGGDIHFGPDGYLYIGMGDGGSGGDPNDRGQTKNTLLGAMLRIDVDNPTPPETTEGGTLELCGINPNGAYDVPDDNPFLSTTGTCDEIWAIGVRNPFRWSFDRMTGDLWIGDVGQGPSNAREEVDFQPASSTGGENYGWSCMEGFQTPNYNPCLPEPLTDPVHDYTHSFGNAITGGFRYRGSAIPELFGLYVYADSGSGRIWGLDETSPGVFSNSQWMDTAFFITTFGEDDDGELYLADFSGTVRKFFQPSLFADGFESGDTSLWDAVAP